MRRREPPLHQVGTDPDPRFSFANERTFLAWIRTALALVVAGLAVIHLLPPFEVPGGRQAIGLPLIALGTLIALTSYRRWERNERAMRLGTSLPSSRLPILIAYAIAAIAVVAVVLAVFAGGS
jgi:putative membrane protein